MDRKKEIRLKDIARELNVSIVSVSNALNGKKGVGDRLRQKVRDKADELGYQMPQRLKENPEKKIRGYSIGIVIAQRCKKGISPFYMNVYKEIVRCISANDGLTVLEFAGSDLKQVHTAGGCFTGVDIDGIIFLGEPGGEVIYEVRSRKKVPAVGIDFYGTDGQMDYIVPDYFHETRRILQQYIDAGHREIAFTGNPYESDKMLDCYMGYCSVLQSNGIKECRITEEEENDAAMLNEMRPYSCSMERILAQNGVNLLMKRLSGESSWYGIWVVACHG